MNRVFRCTICNMIGHRADALSEGNEKKAREYTRVLAEKGVRLGEVASTLTAMQDANAVLGVCRASFDPQQVATAARIERWDTMITCSDEFTVHVLVGIDGRKIGHKIVEWY